MKCPIYEVEIDSECHVLCNVGKLCDKKWIEYFQLEDLVQAQGEILAAMSREGASSPEILEIQCGLSREYGKNLAELWKLKELRGEI